MRIAVAGGTGVVGHHVVEAARLAGHETVVLARSTGVDTRSGKGLADALSGADVVVDTTNFWNTETQEVTDFFVASTTNLSRLGATAGVRHLVVLSIVGIDRVPTGYYPAKVAQERAALSGPVPATILRATQFHEITAQLLDRTRNGPSAQVPDFRVRTVAARTVGQILVDAAEETPANGRAADVCGPNEANLLDLARQFTRRFDLGLEVVPVDWGVPPGALLPGEDARIEGPTFDEWLAGNDAEGLGRAF